MKCIITVVCGLLAICYAAPIPNSEHSIRDVNLQADTDRLLFKTSMPDFQTARNAQNPAGLDWYSNGCSYSPDAPLGYDFTQSCQRHDFGYHNYKNQNRFTSDNKDKIDNNFKSDLYNECGKHGTLSKAVCQGVANVYWLAVSAFGGTT